MRTSLAILSSLAILLSSTVRAEETTKRCLIQLNTGNLVFKQTGPIGDSVTVTMANSSEVINANIGGEFFGMEIINEIRIKGLSLYKMKLDKSFLTSMAIEKSLDEEGKPTMAQNEIEKAIKDMDCN